jgi:hypothetical protein
MAEAFFALATNRNTLDLQEPSSNFLSAHLDCRNLMVVPERVDTIQDIMTRSCLFIYWLK